MGEFKRVRNLGYLPYIEEEGEFIKKMPIPPDVDDKKLWHADLDPNERMFFHQTLNSARRFAGFKTFPKLPDCSLDFVLSSQYKHDGYKNEFPEKVDIVLQHETVGKPTFRRIRNTRDLSPERFILLGHPLVISGITKKMSPHNIKLMNSGHHTNQTNPGYSRQTGDGNFYRY